MPYLYIDSYYLLLVVPAIIFSMIAQAKVSGAFKKYSAQPARRGVTGAEAASAVLRRHGIYDVGVQATSGSLTDHYDPGKKVIRLSESVYASTSISAVGVAAHEAGHAVQHAQGYVPLKLRSAAVPMANIGSMLWMPLVLIGLFLNQEYLFLGGIAIMLLALVAQAITLPVEFDASRRALATLDEGRILYEDELPAAKRVLSAAALTYVAAFAVALAQLLRFVLLFLNRGRRR